MSLLAVAEPALVLDSETPLSKVISQMLRADRHEAIILDGKAFQGIVTARALAIHPLPSPDRTLLPKGLIQRTPLFTPYTEPEDLIAFVLEHNVTTVPLFADGSYRLITKLALLGLMEPGAFRGKTAADVAVMPYSLAPTDTLDAAQALLRDFHVSRLVVLNAQGRADGILDALAILKSRQAERIRPRRGGIVGEKIHMLDVLTSSPAFLQTALPRVRPDAPLAEVAALMRAQKAGTVIVEDDRFRGIITPTALLKLHAHPLGHTPVNLTGVRVEDPFTRGRVEGQISHALEKLGKVVPIRYAAFHIERHHKDGGKRVKYCVRSRLYTNRGAFFAKDYDWDLSVTFTSVLDTLEREVLKALERRRELQRRL